MFDPDWKPIPESKEEHEQHDPLKLFEPFRCPTCGANVSKSTLTPSGLMCLNACHLTPMSKRGFQALMTDVAERMEKS